MEQIKVNMTPNNEVKTIHCSKGDGKTRKWGFQLYKEDGAIDASSISPQMFFDSYKGGTEQILPENTSVPTTSPIIADIQYKDALRSEQEFLYRESPATVDGKAKITKIKGNTVVFNQLVQNGNFADTSGWTFNNGTGSASNNVLTYTITTQVSGEIGNRLIRDISLIQGHKYYFVFDLLSPRTVLSSGQDSFKIYLLNSSSISVNSAGFSATANVWEHKAWMFTANQDIIRLWLGTGTTTFNVSDVIKYKNIMCFDLTSIGIDSLTTTSEVEAWLSSHIGNLPYYDYTQGKLLPFKGESLKTTGENLFDINDIQIGKNWIYGSASDRAIIEFDVEPNTSYTICIENYSSFNPISAIYKVGYVGYQISNIAILSTEQTIITPQDCHVLCIQFAKANISMADFYSHYICALANTFSTLSLPTLNYFPTGMKDVPDYTNGGRIFDELTENKVYTRVGSVDLGTLTYTYDSSLKRFYSGGLSSLAKFPIDDGIVANVTSSAYSTVSIYVLNNDTSLDKVIGLTRYGNIMMRNLAYTDANTFQSAMSGVYLHYELATPTETTIQTASLVSENVEIPLYEDNDILVGECDELLSAESGFVPVKIKYQDDETIYSQKINLHVEKQI